MKYSAVIPVFNEEGSINSLGLRLKGAMDALAEDYEIIFVNDGSTDKSLQFLNDLALSIPRVRVINFLQNKGQGKALEEGFRQSKGEIIISMDADLQTDPADIPLLIAKINQGFDLVCGWRYRRNDSLVKIIKSKIGNSLQRMITRIHLHDMSCTFRAYRKDILKGLTLEGKYDFSLLPFIISKNYSVKITEVKVIHNPRESGSTKYSVFNTITGTIFSYAKSLWKHKSTV